MTITATRSHPYAFDTNDTLSATLTVTATDRAGNQTTQPFHVIEDTGAPTVTIQVPPVAPLRFWVSWSGQDEESGLRDYDVQYKVGITGTWTSWLTHTPQTEAPFVGEAGQSYFFQVKATDHVNNTSAWVEAGPVTVSAVTKYYYHGGQRVAMRQGDVVYFIHSDHLGSTSLTTDQSGAPVAETRYLPYGEGRWITGTLVTDFTFTGQRAEAGFRLMECEASPKHSEGGYNARYYDPGLGRFVSADTVVPDFANPQALNRYAYTLGNSLRYMDPSGHYIFEESPDRDDLHAFYPPGWAAPGGEPFVRDVAMVCDTVHFAHEPTTREMVIVVGAPFAGATAMATASVATAEEAGRFALNEGLAVAGYTGGVMAITCKI